MKVDVATDQPYQVQIAPGVISELPGLVRGADRIAIIHSPGMYAVVERLHRILSGVELMTIAVPDAEAAKTPQILASCWAELAGAGFTRSDVIIGLGGGATTDLAGFVAATWLRGVGYIAIPTSVLAMVDAAVGGKTGINLPAGKNLVGAFWQPRGVLCDLELLGTLPAAEVSSGLAEVIKCGFISDTTILELVQSNPRRATDMGSDDFAELVVRAIQVKAAVVSEDLRERTSTSGRIGREALNYGHTIGHAIETVENYTWRHGAAISVGMVWAAEVSGRLLGLDKASVRLHRDLLSSVGLPVSYKGEWRKLRQVMGLDKKARGTVLRLIGVPRLGSVELLTAPDEDVLALAWESVE